MGAGDVPGAAVVHRGVDLGGQGNLHPDALDDPLLVRGEAVEGVVGMVEVRLQAGGGGRGREGDFDRIVLCHIPHEGDVLGDDPLREAARLERLAEWRDQFLPDRLEAGGVPAVPRHPDRPLLAVADVGDQAAEGRETAGDLGHDHLRHAELAGQAGGMHRPGAAEGQERGPPPVDPAFHRYPAERARHRRVGNPEHAERAGDYIHAEGTGQRFERPAREVRVEVDGVTESPLGIEIAQNQVGVGHRRLATTLAVAGGSRVGARALRPDGKAPRAKADDRAAAGADRMHVHHRLAKRPAGDGAVVADLRPAVPDQADVGRGAAHVETQHQLAFQPPAGAGRRRDAGGGTGERHDQRALADRVGRGHATRRVEDMQSLAQRHLALQLRQIVDGDRHDGGVERGGRRPLELARLRIDPVGEGDVAGDLRQSFADADLVRRVGVAVEEGDGDGGGAAGPGRVDGLGNGLVLEGHEDLAPVVEPFPDGKAARGGYDGG